MFADVMRADVLSTVSHYTARQFLAGATAVGGARLADALAESIMLRYPGLPPAGHSPGAGGDRRPQRFANEGYRHATGT